MGAFNHKRRSLMKVYRYSYNMRYVSMCHIEILNRIIRTEKVGEGVYAVVFSTIAIGEIRSSL